MIRAYATTFTATETAGLRYDSETGQKGNTMPAQPTNGTPAGYVSGETAAAAIAATGGDPAAPVTEILGPEGWAALCKDYEEVWPDITAAELAADPLDAFDWVPRAALILLAPLVLPPPDPEAAAAREGHVRHRAAVAAKNSKVNPADLFDFARDFSALRAPEPLIHGLIDTGAAVQVIAPPNVGKTFLVLGWSCSLALRGRTVVYVIADDSMYQFVRRVLGWCAAHGAEPRTVFANLRLFTRAAQFADDGDMDAITELASGAAMVVFDTQHQCSEGLAENSNDDSRTITRAAVRITRTGAAVTLVHHAADDGRTGRGAKSVHGFITTSLALSEVEQDGQRYLKVRTGKQKNRERGKPVLYPVERVEIPEELRGQVIPERDAWTLVVRTDPFDSPVIDRVSTIEEVRRYCVLRALLSSPLVPLPVTRIAKLVREAAKPMLADRGLLSAAGNMPKGFTDQAVAELLTELSTSEPVSERPVDDSDSTARTAYYSLTKPGESDLHRVAVLLGIDSENDD